MKLEDRYKLALSELPTDLRAISVDIRWAFNDGYTPARSIERTSGIITGPDNVKGPKFDFGIGNHKSREAFHTACKLLKATEVRLAVAILYTNKSKLSKLAAKDQPLRMLDHSLCMTLVIQDLLLQEEAMSQVVKAYSHSWQCRCSLQSALQTPVKELKPDIEVSKCFVCELRLASDKASGGRCDTCYQYLHRKGKERPKALDKGSSSFYEEALAAQRKRKAVGAGYGAS